MASLSRCLLAPPHRLPPKKPTNTLIQTDGDKNSLIPAVYSTRHLITDLEVRGQLHGSDRVDVLLNLCEQVVSTSDDLALVLVVDQLQLVTLPYTSHTWEEE